MTQQEFNERTGLNANAETYESIEKVYMNTDLDKDTFCKAWESNRGLLHEIETKTVLARILAEELQEQQNQMVGFLIVQAEKWSAIDLRNKAIQMIGEKEYLRRKIEKGYNLWEEDKKMLIEILLEK